MKKEFSFYEFSGILTPGALFLFSLHYVLLTYFNNDFFEISNIGDAFFQGIVAYAFGHFIQGFGNFYEKFIWFLKGGMPTSWLKTGSEKQLFKGGQLKKILAKLQLEKYSMEQDNGIMIYNKIINYGGNTERIDIFNSYYSLYRGLAVSCIFILGLLCFTEAFILAFIFAILFFLSTYRMIRFAKLYAKEIYRTYLNMNFDGKENKN